MSTASFFEVGELDTILAAFLSSVVAYESLWAIGTGRTATPETAQQMHSVIRSCIRAMFGDGVAAETRILYGGSVKPDNIVALMDQVDIDGGLVGGASLDADSFARIV